MSTKPRSMPVGHRNILRPNDSLSLWNATLSPGWQPHEAATLRLALMRFGIGNWKDIMESGALPGKTNAQLNLQTQRMLGQQSTAEFQGLHVDVNVIGRKNARIAGVRRKNGFIVNDGGKLTREEKLRRIKANRELYELPKSEYTAIELPVHDAVDPHALIAQKEALLNDLVAELRDVRAAIRGLRQHKGQQRQGLGGQDRDSGQEEHDPASPLPLPVPSSLAITTTTNNNNNKDSGTTRGTRPADGHGHHNGYSNDSRRTDEEGGGGCAGQDADADRENAGPCQPPPPRRLARSSTHLCDDDV